MTSSTNLTYYTGVFNINKTFVAAANIIL